MSLDVFSDLKSDVRRMVVQNYDLPFQPQIRLLRVQSFEEKEDVVSVGGVAEAIVELVIMGRDGPYHSHGLLSGSRQLDVDIVHPRHPDAVFLLPEVRAALVNVDDLQVPAIVVDDGCYELLSVFFELFFVLG